MSYIVSLAIRWKLTGASVSYGKIYSNGGKPQIFNTDLGSQFTSDDFVAVLLRHEIAISWDGKGRALDNIYVERFWQTLKYKDAHSRNHQTGSDLRAGLIKCFHYYNHQRSHQSLGCRTQAAVFMEKKEK